MPDIKQFCASAITIKCVLLIGHKITIMGKNFKSVKTMSKILCQVGISTISVQLLELDDRCRHLQLISRFSPASEIKFQKLLEIFFEIHFNKLWKQVLILRVNQHEQRRQFVFILNPEPGIYRKDSNLVVVNSM